MLDMLSTMTNIDKNKLGKYLKVLREEAGLSLRAVEEKSGISNAFLSQIESGKVKQPSPIALHKLSQVYGVSYESLMEVSGYPVIPHPERTSLPTGPLHRLGPLTDNEEKSLADYLVFLRSKSGRDRK